MREWQYVPLNRWEPAPFTTVERGRLRACTRSIANAMLALPPSTSPLSSAEAESSWSRIHRYFFYAWLFRDADSGSVLERSAARRNNRDQAKWLPTYLLRWTVTGSLLVGLERLSERLTGDSVLTAALAVSITLVVTYCLITFVCWAFLRSRRQSD